jgi:hypothetical protein
MTGVKGKSGRKKRAGPVGHFLVTCPLENYQLFRFWCEHVCRSPNEVICELMDRYVSECIAIEQTVDRVRAVDIARRTLQQDLKRQALEHRTDALLFERKKDGSV